MVQYSYFGCRHLTLDIHPLGGGSPAGPDHGLEGTATSLSALLRPELIWNDETSQRHMLIPVATRHQEVLETEVLYYFLRSVSSCYFCQEVCSFLPKHQSHLKTQRERLPLRVTAKKEMWKWRQRNRGQRGELWQMFRERRGRVIKERKAKRKTASV